MKKLLVTLSVGLFSFAFSQESNATKENRAYFIQNETNATYASYSNEVDPKKLQEKIDEIKEKENVMPYSQVPLLSGTIKPVFGAGKQDFVNRINSSIDRTSVSGNGTQYTTVTFLVDQNGKVSDVKASGNNQTLNLATILAIYNIKEGFTPAKYKGENISTVVRMNIPVNL